MEVKNEMFEKWALKKTEAIKRLTATLEKNSTEVISSWESTEREIIYKLQNSLGDISSLDNHISRGIEVLKDEYAQLSNLAGAVKEFTVKAGRILSVLSHDTTSKTLNNQHTGTDPSGLLNTGIDNNTIESINKSGLTSLIFVDNLGKRENELKPNTNEPIINSKRDDSLDISRKRKAADNDDSGQSKGNKSSKISTASRKS